MIDRNRDDCVFKAIDELNRMNGTPEGGYFRSSKDKAYRLEAIRQIFCGLKRENQDKVLRCAMETLLDQTPCISEGTFLEVKEKTGLFLLGNGGVRRNVKTG